MKVSMIQNSDSKYSPLDLTSNQSISNVADPSAAEALDSGPQKANLAHFGEYFWYEV
jgi:hypothetical protein